MKDIHILNKVMQMYPGLIVVAQNACMYFMDKDICSAPLNSNSYFDFNRTGFYASGFQLILRLDKISGDLFQNGTSEISDETLMLMYGFNINTHIVENHCYKKIDTQAANRKIIINNIINGNK